MLAFKTKERVILPTLTRSTLYRKTNMARVPFTHQAYEAWIHNSSRSGYSGRVVIGNWFTKPTEEMLCMVVPKGVSLSSVKIDEMSVIKREGQWYRVMRRPIAISGKDPIPPACDLVVKDHLVWPVPNEDKSATAIIYVDRRETDTIQALILEGCTLKVTTVNDVVQDTYALTCRESTYRRICERYGLSRTEGTEGQAPPVGEA